MSILETVGYAIGARAAALLGRIIYGRKGTAMAKNNQGQRIANAVAEFVDSHIDREFTSKELRVFVLSRVTDSAPSSADRIMRMLRKQGTINYVLVKRQLSIYRGLPVPPKVDLVAGTFPEAQ